MRSRRLPLGGSGSRRDRAASEVSAGSPADKSESETTKKAQAPPATPKSQSRSSRTAANGSALKSPPTTERRSRSATLSPPAPNHSPTLQGAAENGKAAQDIKSTASKAKETPVSRKSLRESSRKRKGSNSLTALTTDGSEVSVSVWVEGNVVSADDADASTTTSPVTFVGNDGNQYYCQICREFGDVVCCDGCPSVYHPRCVPAGPSRQALENDEDPWYCPKCINKKKPTREKEDRAASLHFCVDCETNIDGLPVEPCKECGNYVHFPSCRTNATDSKRALCSTCHAVDALSQQDEANFEEEEEDAGDEDVEMDQDDGSQMEGSGTLNSQGSDEEEELTPRARRKKRKFSIDSSEKKRKDGSLKKKKRKKSMDFADESSRPESESQDLHSSRAPQIAMATPGFFFYLAENRWKIERVLSRRSRGFNRLPRGHARNVSVAKEAAIWWSKLRPSDHKRYVNMSMRDFESRVIEWKEDKNIREMHADLGAAEVDPETDLKDFSEEDKRLTARKHKRLYISTSVGSKVFKPEKGQHYNRVLLDLLHDSRFHPLPMLGVNQNFSKDNKAEKDDPSSKVLIPHFEIHGPVSTSVGDECLGCLRGWAHYCPVLQRRLPALDARAKLQPPMSSLQATRIGLGLRQPLWKRELPPSVQQGKDANLFEERESKEYKRLRDLPVLPSATLADTNERVDDVAEFIEQSMAMRVPEPPRPDDDAYFAKAMKDLPGKANPNDNAGALHKCGRCRAILRGDTGCFQCRRAQLVINLAKRNKQDAGRILRVQTTMLGRLNLHDRNETQTPEDQAVAAAILKERWMPTAVLEPRKIYAPGSGTLQDPVLENESESSSDESVHSESGTSGDTQSSAPSSVPRAYSARNDKVPTEKGRPVRSARNAPSYQESYEPGDNQAVLENNRKQVNSFQKRLVTIACCGMLHALVRRDPLMLFAHKVTVEGYLDVVKDPIDFSIIRNKLKSDGYSSVPAFCADIRLLCENALLYNAPTTIYAKTANEMLELLSQMQKNAVDWITTLRDAYARHLAGDEARRRKMMGRLEDLSHSSEEEGDPFQDIRQEWPEAVEMLDNEEWLKSQVFTDFTRSKENEVAYYGSLAVSRAAYAAEVSLAPYSDSKGIFNIVGMRSHLEDAALRQRIDGEVAKFIGPPRLQDPSTWREESVHRLLRRLQSRRLDAKTASEQGCARCDGLDLGQDVQIVMKAEQAAGKAKRSEEHKDITRVDPTRVDLTTGLASKNNREVIEKRRKQNQEEQFDSVGEASVSVRGSAIHGWGLYADQKFAEEDVVAEYVGEYIDNNETEAREKRYREQRIQDYMFRVNDDLVIDATMKGGNGRYANHSCAPNCYTKNIFVDGNKSLRRVMIIAMRPIEVNEEITYDYQFPLEMDLHSRLPCNCGAESCRGFMNWDLPERGNVTPMLVQKRGANMRDRIRRLGRPLKRDEA